MIRSRSLAISSYTDLHYFKENQLELGKCSLCTFDALVSLRIGLLVSCEDWPFCIALFYILAWWIVNNLFGIQISWNRTLFTRPNLSRNITCYVLVYFIMPNLLWKTYKKHLPVSWVIYFILDTSMLFYKETRPGCLIVLSQTFNYCFEPIHFACHWLVNINHHLTISYEGITIISVMMVLPLYQLWLCYHYISYDGVTIISAMILSDYFLQVFNNTRNYTHLITVLNAIFYANKRGYLSQACCTKMISLTRLPSAVHETLYSMFMKVGYR